MKSSAFNIHIIDNFFPENIYKKILESIPNMNWSSSDLYDSKREGDHLWISNLVHPEDEITGILINLINEKTLFKIKKFKLLSYTLQSQTSEPYVHSDEAYGEERGKTHSQILIYIDGSVDINKGTGFYVKQGNQWVLNTHVGFFKNRAILFPTGVWHSPLTWNSKDGIPRIALIGQF